MSFSAQLGMLNKGLLSEKIGAKDLSAWQIELANYHLSTSPEFNSSDMVFAVGLCLDRHWEIALQASHSLDKSFPTPLSKNSLRKDSPVLVYEQQSMHLAALLRCFFLKDIDKSLNLRFSPFAQLSFGIKMRLKERFGYAEIVAKQKETLLENMDRFSYAYKEYFSRKKYGTAFFMGVACGIAFEFAGLRFFGHYEQRFFLQKLYNFPPLSLLASRNGESAFFSFPEIFNYGFFQVGLAYLFNARVSRNTQKLFIKQRKSFEQRIG